mmetsp:Transcript_23155/g.64386  ORF Transcript_23155/g.64386 Transcript_23155/m.64386 type:complete len:232 (-) Transcript_23155:952-1647(-)
MAREERSNIPHNMSRGSLDLNGVTICNRDAIDNGITIGNVAEIFGAFETLIFCLRKLQLQFFTAVNGINCLPNSTIERSLRNTGIGFDIKVTTTSEPPDSAIQFDYGGNRNVTVSADHFRGQRLHCEIQEKIKVLSRHSHMSVKISSLKVTEVFPIKPWLLYGWACLSEDGFETEMNQDQYGVTERKPHGRQRRNYHSFILFYHLHQEIITVGLLIIIIVGNEERHSSCFN